MCETSKINKDDKRVVQASLVDWEENMVSDLSKEYNVPAETVLAIGLTFVVNEMSAAMNQQPCVINTITPKITSENSEESNKEINK